MLNTQASSGSSKKPIREQLISLVQVQEVDLKIDRLNAEKNALPAQLKVLDQSIAQFKKTADAKTAEIAEFEKTARQTKAAMELNQDRMDRAAKKLENVGNSQEFQAATKEIEQLKKASVQLETQATKIAADIEAIKKGVESITAQMATVQTERDAKAAELASLEGKLSTDLNALVGERSSFLGGVEVTVLSRYDRIRGARAGVGIAAAVTGRCTACNLVVPPQMFNELQKGLEIHNCPSCQRLLYVPKS